ncbi:sporulation protein [Nocardiopsis halotolerans]|uniref:sporulation protein n=1 Tax=Nocardiopsis halotolerans TaxID=124252 RepID=UPI000381072C|nr:sporulation protein [Nocardiopsis halotolerans]
MVLKRLLAAFGVGGPTVDTVVPHPHVQPGALLEGTVELTGGEADTDIAEIVLVLVTRTEDGEDSDGVEHTRVPVSADLSLGAGEHLSVPFGHPVPWQAPVTEAGGSPLPGMVAGLRTEVVVDGAADKGDLDRVHIHPLVVQDRVMEAMFRLGFTFSESRVEHRPLPDAPQDLPFLQSLVFHPSPEHELGVEEVELLLAADPSGVSVALAFDRHGDDLPEEAEGRLTWFRAEHADADRTDWVRLVEEWIGRALYRHRGFLGHPGHDGEDGEQEGGGMLAGLGGVALGVAGGLAAGYVAAEVVDEIGDAFEDDAEEEEEDSEEEED